MSSRAPTVQPPTEEAPGVPGFRTWGEVYLLVFIWFVIVVVLLTIFTRAFA